uniref:Tr-type G domain-containing protein n=1 Tax=Mesocestoides corti TaxID=53468 RepID=A0A5K3ESD2_MESCO
MERSPQNILADKRVFVAPNDSDFECLKQCLTIRLEGGQGECFVELGIGEGQDPGLPPADMDASVATLQLLAQLLNAKLIHLRDRTVVHQPSTASDAAPATAPATGGKERTKRKAKRANASASASTSPNASTTSATTIPAASTTDAAATAAAEKPTTPTTTAAAASSTGHSADWIVKDFLLRQVIGDRDFIDIRVAVVGNVDAGKSTMLGVLTHGELDNGRGLARQHLFRHKHELESGRTSSVSNNILGFDADGKVVNRAVHGKLDWAKICQASTKVITFIDLAGHERYLKTTVFGLTGFAPDYAMLMIGANAGIVGMTKEHLGLALALSVPVFVVITKVDMCPTNVLNETVNYLFRLLKSPGCRKMPVLVSTQDGVVCSATNFTSERMCPVFLVSNVTGSNLDLLTSFLNLLSTPRSNMDSSPYPLDKPAEFQIDELFTVPGVGAIVSGTCMSGVISVNDNLQLGPDTSGRFFPVLVKSIHRKRMPVQSVKAGQTASFSLKRPKGCQLRRGMVLLAKGTDAVSCVNFTATVLVLHHPTTISVGYQAMVHAGPIRQTATILSIGAGQGEERLRTGDKAEVHFAFINHPEFLHKGTRLIFREGKTKAVGTVNHIVPYQPVLAPPAAGRSKKTQKPPSRTPVVLSTTPPPPPTPAAEADVHDDKT